MPFYNPFKNIIETSTFPHARTLRTTFKQKALDAFSIFAGSFFDKESVNHVGLFDYATLFIPYFFGTLLSKRVSAFIDSLLSSLIINFFNYLLGVSLSDKIAEEKNQLSTIFLLSITLLFAIPRYLSAAILTVLSLPIIAIVHGFSLIEGASLKKKALHIKGVVNDEQNPQTLEEHLKNRKLNFENLLLENRQVTPESENPKSKRLGLFFCDDSKEEKNSFSYTTVFKKSDTTDTDKIKATLEPMLKLNIGGIAAKLESDFPNENPMDSLFKTLKPI